MYIQIASQSISPPPNLAKSFTLRYFLEMEKDKNILVRVSAADQLLIKSRAAAAGSSSLSAYARQMLIAGKIILIEPADQRTIAGLANNLNQLTRHANSSGVLPADVVDTLHELIKELRYAYRQR